MLSWRIQAVGYSCSAYQTKLPSCHLLPRGGNSEKEDDNNAEMDAYIDALVAGVSDDSEAHDEAKPDQNGEVVAKVRTNEEEDVDDFVLDVSNDSLFVGTDSSSVGQEDSSANDAENVPFDQLTMNEKEDCQGTTPVQSQLQTALTDEVGIFSQVGEASPSSRAPQRLKQRRYQRPNAVYRFLLDLGLIGRLAVMFFIWLAEFVHAFVPPIANGASAILVAVFGKSKLVDYDDEDDESNFNNLGRVNDQYVAFVDSRRTLRGKEKKKAIKLADQEAAEQLRRIGSVAEARYRHLSQDFMQRHGLGPFARHPRDENDSEELSANVYGTAQQDGATSVEEDDDVDWVVTALTQDVVKPLKTRDEASNKPSINVGMSTEGVTVGVSFSIGGSSPKKKKKLKQRRKLIEAVTSNVSDKRVKAGPRVSDREGGGGVFGRIRDFGANNLVSRSLLGAYPGDALPPTEAASATGLAEFAMKYGYGDWSDEDDLYHDEPSRKKPKSRRRSSNSSTTRKKKLRSASTSNLSLDFDFSTSTPKTSSVAPVRNPTSSSTKRVDLESQLLPRADSTNQKSKKMVRLPLERLREKESMISLDSVLESTKSEKATTTPTTILSEDAAERSKKRTSKLVRLPTELLKEKENEK